jgi:hypothetical protein
MRPGTTTTKAMERTEEVRGGDTTGTTRTSLQRALEANRQVQEVIQQQIKHVKQQKQNNRIHALQIIQQFEDNEKAFQSVPSPPVTLVQPKQVNDFFRKRALAKHAKRLQDATNPTEHHEQQQQQQDTPEIPFRRLPASRTKHFPYDLNRRWDTEYFVDPTNDRPDPNADVLRRQQIRGNLIDGGPLNTSSTTRKLPKDALRLLLRLVGEYTTSTTGRTSSPSDHEEHTIIRWDAIQRDMNNTYAKQRTIWELVAAYAHYSATQLVEENHTTVMNPKQDELLLRYLALQGPQLVWDNLAVGPLCSGTALSRLGHPVAGHQVIVRSHYTSFNLRLTPTPYWKIHQERKLMLLIKMYQETTQHENGPINDGEEDDTAPPDQDASTTRKAKKPRTDACWAITQAATHFPSRTRDQVRRKWERSLDPGLDHQPFTDEEDATLKRAIQDALKASQTYTLADVARTHFPNRKSHQIYARWLEIGTPEEIVAFDAKQVTSSLPQDFQLRFTTL